MELQTINNIREKRDNIRAKIKNVNFKIYNSLKFGGENKYEFKQLIIDIEEILTDLSTLTRAPRKFVKISTSSERTNIVSYLTYIDTYFESPNNYIPHFEALKTLLRNYNIRSYTERKIEFETELEETKKIKIQLQQELTSAENLVIKIKTLNDAIEEKIK